MAKIVSLKVLEAIVIEYEAGRPDQCALIVELPDPMDKGSDLYFDFRAPIRTGADYIRSRFGIEPTVSRMPKARPKFNRENS